VISKRPEYSPGHEGYKSHSHDSEASSSNQDSESKEEDKEDTLQMEMSALNLTKIMRNLQPLESIEGKTCELGQIKQ